MSLLRESAIFLIFRQAEKATMATQHAEEQKAAEVGGESTTSDSVDF